VDTTAKTFLLTSSGNTQSVQWSDTTVFLGLTADSLSGKLVHVDGYTNSGVLMARVIRLDDDSNSGVELDGKLFRHKIEFAKPAAWTKYFKSRK